MLYSLASGSWLAWADNTAAHYAVIHCPPWRTVIGPAVQHTDIPPFCVKIGWGVWPPGWFEKKSKKITDFRNRKDMSPLTQGLNYLPFSLRCRKNDEIQHSNDLIDAMYRVAGCFIYFKIRPTYSARLHLLTYLLTQNNQCFWRLACNLVSWLFSEWFVFPSSAFVRR